MLQNVKNLMFEKPMKKKKGENSQNAAIGGVDEIVTIFEIVLERFECEIADALLDDLGVPTLTRFCRGISRIVFRTQNKQRTVTKTTGSKIRNQQQ